MFYGVEEQFGNCGKYGSIVYIYERKSLEKSIKKSCVK